MDKYLKMSSYFVGNVSINADGQICDDKYFRGSTDIAEDYYEPICHAINSHDELVEEVERLRMLELGASQLEKLKKACTNMGIATPESIEYLGVYQHRYISMLISAAIDM